MSQLTGRGEEGGGDRGVVQRGDDAGGADRVLLLRHAGAHPLREARRDRFNCGLALRTYKFGRLAPPLSGARNRCICVPKMSFSLAVFVGQKNPG